MHLGFLLKVFQVRLFEKCQAVKPSKLPFQVLTRARQKALLLEQRPLGE